ncbi:MAG: GtrA family protein [Alphaproteobacteria bacterium]
MTFLNFINRYPSLRQFFSFALVGVVGLIADAGVLSLMTRAVGLDPFSGRIVSFLAAVTVTWALNRHFTFRGLGKGSLIRQWTKFCLANLSGFAANFATYTACVAFIPLCHAIPELALIPASLVGLIFNYTASKHLVFR